VKLGPEELAHLAKLAALPLRDDEIARFARDLQRIASHVETILAVDVEGVAPTFGVGETPAPMREDVARPGLSHEDALASAPQEAEGGFAVPTFVES
jgi:aspartyl-tRNA(Asn)/glutamyl-tRNA(Gln) amidotransferase subunit C